MERVGSKNVIKHLTVTGSASVRIVISDANWLEDAAVEQLRQVAGLPGMLTVVGMPDLHPGKGQPIGAAFITDGTIYPHLVGSDIGCGMALWTLDVKRRGLPVDKWERRLLRLSDLCDRETLEAWVQDELTEQPDMDINCMDKLGSIGGGNHFVEIQQLHQIGDKAVLNSLGLHAHSVVLVVHSGSRGLGQYLLAAHLEQHGTRGLTGSAARSYLDKHDYALRWAQINRRVIARRFAEALGSAATPVLDLSHNHVCRLPADSERPETCRWIHRKGAAPADRGVVVIPGSRGSCSYLVQPRTDDPTAMALGGYSLAHGAGRKWKRSECRSRLASRFTVKDLETTAVGSRVICKQRALLYEEAPQAYKNIDVVVADLEKAGMVNIIATCRPLLTFKTSGK